MMSVAVTFAHTGEIANPYMKLSTGPTAHVGPIYPMLIGYLYRVLGDGDTAEMAKQVLGCTISSGRSFLLVVLALALGLSEWTALCAGVISALYIGAYETELKGDWEGPLAANVLIFLILWGHRISWRRVPRGREGFLYGLSWGVALLIAPSLLPVALSLTLAAFLSGLIGGRPAARRSLTLALVWFAAGCALSLSPWIIRNYRVLGGFVWGRDNLGLELSVSNGPYAKWSDSRNDVRMHMVHPSRSLPAAEKVLAQGELAFNRDRKQEAIEWIRRNPGEFATLTVQRTFYFWFPPGRNLTHEFALGGFTLFAFAGLWFLWRQSLPAGVIVALLWASYPLIYCVIQWSSRYRQPIEWSLALCAGTALSVIFPATRPRRPSSRSG
jgi:hypothetical protein